jgi:hypothetical protein
VFAGDLFLQRVLSAPVAGVIAGFVAGVLVAGIVTGGAIGVAGGAFPEAGEFLHGVVRFSAFGLLLLAFAEVDDSGFAEIQFFACCFFHITGAGFVILKTGKNFCDYENRGLNFNSSRCSRALSRRR